MPNPFLKERTLLGIKILSISVALFLTGVEVYNQIKSPAFSKISNINFYSLRRLLGNSFVICLFVLLTIFPHKLEFFATASFYYSFICFIDDLNNPMATYMFFLGISIFYIRGFFINKKKPKIFLSIIVYIILLISKFRFGRSIFLEILINHLGYTIVLSTILFILISYKENILSYVKSREINKTLNLSQYSDLVENDVLLLRKVLENKQYKIIADEVFRAEGTVRNRLNKIYDILGVMDRMGFISTYMGYEIIFKTEDKSSDNKTMNKLLYKKK